MFTHVLNIASSHAVSEYTNYKITQRWLIMGSAMYTITILSIQL